MVHLTGAPNYPAANPAIAVLCYVEEQRRAAAARDRQTKSRLWTRYSRILSSSTKLISVQR
jgi:hypothetical protein